MLAAGQAGQLGTDQRIDTWAGEITKQWSSLVAQKQTARASKFQALTTAPLQEGNEETIVSQNGGLSAEDLDFSTSGGSAGRCVLMHITSST